MEKSGGEVEAAKVPASRRTPRLKVEVKSGFRTMATVIGSQYERRQPRMRLSTPPAATQPANRSA